MDILALETPHLLDDSAFVIPHPAPINYTNIVKTMANADRNISSCQHRIAAYDSLFER